MKHVPDIIWNVFLYYKFALDDKKPSEIAISMQNKYGTVPVRMTKNGKKLGGTIYNENFIRRVLTNPTYAGYVYRNGGKELYEGKHQALIKRKDWEKIQKILSIPICKNRPEIHKGSNLYVLKGKLFCGCGSAMTCGSSGKRKKDGTLFYYYVCSKRNRERTAHICKTRITTTVLESVVFSVLGFYSTKNISAKEIDKSCSDYETSLKEKESELKKAISMERSKLDKMVDKFSKIETNSVLSESFNRKLKKQADLIASLRIELENVQSELKVFEKRFDLGQLQTKSMMDNMDALQAEIGVSEKRAIVESCISKVELSLVKKQGFLSEFTLHIVPDGEYFERFGIIDVAFEVNTSKGKSLWKITTPFEMTSDNYEVQQRQRYKKHKRHWLHKVVKWQNRINSGVQLDEIAKSEEISSAMVCRKLKLLERLHYKIVEAILKIKYAEESDSLSFRCLDRLAKVPKSSQLKSFFLK